ncbi:sulfite exporter TauE/SafE family protein [Azotobacter salinestris]|uniref:sulfite exporter TauE/SafE family protein n=1 Tax=Azotobacter salinestris TaxID=69964 RepID=UPI0032DFFE7C
MERASVQTEAIILAGALSGGFVTGLAGFGTGLTALGFWLHVVEPVVAAALVVICSVVGQLQSLFSLRRAVAWQRAWPFLAGGLAGVPLGVAALRVLDIETFKLLLGVLLVGYTGLMLGLRRLPSVPAWGGRLADGLVGAGGGALGGIAGLSGPLPTLWCGLRGWSADIQRGVYQPYNLGILCVVLGLYAGQGLLTGQIWELAALCLPATVLGSWLGMGLYRRVSDWQFRYLVLWLLLAAGLVPTLSSL